MSANEKGRMRRAWKKLGAAARSVDRDPKLVTSAKFLRELLPGDSGYGDPLSTAGEGELQLVGRRISTMAAERPGLLRETGLTALQVWQALSEAQGRGRSDTEVTIVFTDLVEFSDWALRVGDDAALELLREVGAAIEPAVCERRGRVVKRLGDGMMAVFDEPQGAVEAVIAAREGLKEIKADGYEPRIRAGVHVGRPRRIGGDYLGVDVNIAARLAEHADPDELLLSSRTLELTDTDGLDTRKKKRFKVKGVPEDLDAYSVSPGVR